MRGRSRRRAAPGPGSQQQPRGRRRAAGRGAEWTRPGLGAGCSEGAIPRGTKLAKVPQAGARPAASGHCLGAPGNGPRLPGMWAHIEPRRGAHHRRSPSWALAAGPAQPCGPQNPAPVASSGVCPLALLWWLDALEGEPTGSGPQGAAGGPAGRGARCRPGERVGRGRRPSPASASSDPVGGAGSAATPDPATQWEPEPLVGSPGPSSVAFVARRHVAARQAGRKMSPTWPAGAASLASKELGGDLSRGQAASCSPDPSAPPQHTSEGAIPQRASSREPLFCDPQQAWMDKGPSQV